MRQILRWLLLLLLLGAVEQLAAHSIVPPNPWHAGGTGYVQPAFAVQMQGLRGVIMDVARRNNRPEHSGLSDSEFAVMVATILYNEHNGWFEDLVPPVRRLTPFYQGIQGVLNRVGLGANYSMWPTNLRPSVAEEILRRELPVPGGSVRSGVGVPQSAIEPEHYASRQALLAAISGELARPELAIDYLGANLARGVERARYEGVPVTWQALAAWHNQGIVRSEEISRNDTARSYIVRAATYRVLAYDLVYGAQALRAQ